MSKERQTRREETKIMTDLAAKNNKKINRLIGYGTAFAIVGLIGGTALFSANSKSLSGVKTFDKLTSEHIPEPVKYSKNPPVGGDHSGTVLNCGIYDKPVPNENVLHSLEHGATWITYDPEKIIGEVLSNLRKQVPLTYGIISPYPGLSSPIMISAWGKQLSLSKVDDPRLVAFIKTYTGASSAPEPGAPCTGGLDAPGRIG